MIDRYDPHEAGEPGCVLHGRVLGLEQKMDYSKTCKDEIDREILPLQQSHLLEFALHCEEVEPDQPMDDYVNYGTGCVVRQGPK